MQGLTRKQLETTLLSVDIGLEVLLNKLDDQTRRGGYFCVASYENGMITPVVIALIGELPEEKLQRCFELCQEKARRLATHSEHRSSWQSRDPDQKQYGGAIRVNSDLILSFSGLPEIADEALMLRVAVRRVYLSRDDADAIAAISSNDIFPKIV